MAGFWILVTLLLVSLIGIVIFAGGYLFSEERELIREAEQKIEKGQEQEAVSLLSRVTDLNPANFKARWRLAKLLQMMGQAGASAYHLEFCLEHDSLPSHVRPEDALVRLANVYEQQAHYSDAADTWSRYLQLDPDSVKARFRRAQMFYNDEVFERALTDLETIRAEVEPENHPQTLALYIARSHSGLDSPKRALNYYDEYLEEIPDDFEAAIEAAMSAREAQEFEKARSFYEHIREHADDRLYIDATLRLMQMELKEESEPEIEGYLDELRRYRDADKLHSRQERHLKYLEAKSLERNHQRSEAMDIYWDIYKEKPDYLDVSRIIDEQIREMDPDDLLDEFMNTGRQRFAEQAREIVAMMGYEVMSSEAYGPYELNISAREAGQGLKADRLLVTFKRWGSKVGEWPVREFDLQLLEKRYDRGVFIAPHGFNRRAREYAKQSSIRLIGPETLIEYLREAYKETS